MEGGNDHPKAGLKGKPRTSWLAGPGTVGDKVIKKLSSCENPWGEQKDPASKTKQRVFLTYISRKRKEKAISGELMRNKVVHDGRKLPTLLKRHQES